MTGASFVVGPAARLDLDEHVLWLREQAGPDTAERFSDAADQALLRLAESPGIGSPVGIGPPKLRELRKGRIAGFANVLVFYLPRAGDIYVLRVLHAAQDLHRHLQDP